MPFSKNHIRPLTSVEELETSKERFSILMEEELGKVPQVWGIPLLKKFKRNGQLVFYQQKNNSYLKRALLKDAVLIIPEMVVYSLMQHPEFRDLYLLEGRLNFMQYSLALKKDWPLTNRVKTIVAELALNGSFDALIRQYQQKYHVNSGVARQNEKSNSIPVDKLYGIGIMLGGFSMMAILISFLTVMMPRKISNQKITYINIK